MKLKKCVVVIDIKEAWLDPQIIILRQKVAQLSPSQLPLPTKCCHSQLVQERVSLEQESIDLRISIILRQQHEDELETGLPIYLSFLLTKCCQSHKDGQDIFCLKLALICLCYDSKIY